MQQKRPIPPHDLDGEALLEWGRVCDELEALGLLDAADRALITIYVETWAAHRACAKHVAKFGPILKLHNGVVGQTTHFKTMQETGKQLVTMLAQLGLTPAARGLKTTEDDDATLPTF